MITARHLQKEFKTPVVREGRFSGLRTLFSREYLSKEAVRDISFDIGKGEFVGYIGPNGAGKSTTIKMLTGILHPTSGEVLLGGMNPHQERRRTVGRLGVVFGQRSQLWWDLPVKDSYDILAEMYGVRAEDKKRRLAQFAELLDLESFWATPVRKLSLGQRMRADLAASMLHDPELLFLDEPTIGLDVNAKRNIRQFLRTLNEEFGKTILLTTHDMDDIEQLCSRVMVINHGQLTYDGSIPSLRDTIGLPTLIRVTYRGSFHMPDIISSAIQITGAEGQVVTVEVNRKEWSTMDILKQLEQWGQIEDVEMKEPDFEDIIHRVY
ncbi:MULTISPECIES: ABC transporter ATP-binding protein [unclassified Paenibacillus]|uniref:ABC transporter ATP-binding protein n=1 Tax=unclassified Paenibacillus TaxID=185978 RepID=UPI00046664D3|nr:MULTISPECIES: ATP-binding cassette domain-containing protein [unclassified Paenibacillus]KGP81339.1 ABC transporter ATP-binding protein [Paenibacillus sp. MAEPY2]KGP87682.1 ABC transporter ATP-binding protein [Paenibacillus sp. MAEPY1]